MPRIWFCPKCAARIVITEIMENFPFHCPGCNEVWGSEDIEHFAIGLSSFDVADVHDWLEQRKDHRKSLPEETILGITAREQILLSHIEVALDAARRKNDWFIISMLEECIRKFADACYSREHKSDNRKNIDR
jgi:hypothetical protein